MNQVLFLVYQMCIRDRDNDDSAFCSRSFCVNDYDALDNFFRLKKKRYACELRIEDNFIQPDKDYYKIIQKLINHNYKNDSKKSGKTIENLKQKVIQRKPFFSWLRQSLWNLSLIHIYPAGTPSDRDVGFVAEFQVEPDRHPQRFLRGQGRLDRNAAQTGLCGGTVKL